MSNFVPEKGDLRTSLRFCYFLKKSAAESHQMLVEAYGSHALSEPTCREWFRKFKSGDFDLKDKERSGQPKKFEDAELQALLDENTVQTESELAEALNVDRSTVGKRLHAMGKIQKEGKWVPHKLSERDIERRFSTCEMLYQRYKRKSFLHRIVTGDEKWIYYENPKRKKSWVDPGQPSTSQPKRNIHVDKIMLCIWWDCKGVIYYELLNPKETVTGPLYRLQLIRLNRALQVKRPEYAQRQHKVILLHDNARPHVEKTVKNYLETIKWDVLPHAAYSPDLAPSDYHLFRLMQNALQDVQFKSYEEVKKWIDEWIAAKPEKFFYDGIHKLPERWSKVIASDGKYFD